jgi:flagellar motor switch protein FliN/FliY
MNTTSHPSREPITDAEDPALRHFLDIPIEVGVELDRKRLKVRQVLDLKVGSVLKMDRSAGENVDLVLDGVVVGTGEIVVIEDMMGLRITDLGHSDTLVRRISHL